MIKVRCVLNIKDLHGELKTDEDEDQCQPKQGNLATVSNKQLATLRTIYYGGFNNYFEYFWAPCAVNQERILQQNISHDIEDDVIGRFKIIISNISEHHVQLIRKRFLQQNLRKIDRSVWTQSLSDMKVATVA